MAKNPNRRPDKGFTRELGSNPKPIKPTKKAFDWKDPVTIKSKDTMTMATPSRLANYREAKPTDTSLVDEHNEFTKKRRGGREWK